MSYVAAMDTEQTLASFLLIVGIVIILTTLIRHVFRMAKLPALIGFLLLGFLLRLLDSNYGFITPGLDEVMQFLADIGTIFLSYPSSAI